MKHQARKRFGQNFLIDHHVIHSIIEALDPKPGENLIEIGPGCAALTTQVLKRTSSLIALEIDRDLIAKLQHSSLINAGLSLIEADALNFDFATLAKRGPMRIFGNLPYNVATPLLFHLMTYLSQIADMHFMLQLEVAERVVASPGNKDYGRLSIMLQYLCHTELLFSVPPVAFEPPPKVQSAVVSLRPRKILPHEIVDIKILERVVKQAFAQRRKTLKNNLKDLLTVKELENLGIDPQLRPEQLLLAEYIKISQWLTK